VIAVPGVYSGVYRFLAREEETAEKTKLKKSLQQMFELCEKEMAILVEKAEAEGRRKDRGFVVGSGERQGDLRRGGMRRRRPPPPPPGRAASRRPGDGGARVGGEDSGGSGGADGGARAPTAGRGQGGRARSPFLGRYAAIQKRTAVAAVLDFTDKEWESLKALREADGAATTTATVDDIVGALGMENEMIEGTINEGAV
jgi:hypothetical protein